MRRTSTWCSPTTRPACAPRAPCCRSSRPSDREARARARGRAVRPRPDRRLPDDRPDAAHVRTERRRRRADEPADRARLPRARADADHHRRRRVLVVLRADDGHGAPRARGRHGAALEPVRGPRDAARRERPERRRQPADGARAGAPGPADVERGDPAAPPGRRARLPPPAAPARRRAGGRHRRRAAVRTGADVHALGAAGIAVGGGAGAVAAGRDPGAGATARAGAVRRGGGAGRGRRLRRAAGGAGPPGPPPRPPGAVLGGGGGGPAAGGARGPARRGGGGPRPRPPRGGGLLELVGAALCGALLAAPRVGRTLESLGIWADPQGGPLGDTRLALADVDALVRRKGLQPELLGWPLAIAAVAGAIGWRRRV